MTERIADNEYPKLKYSFTRKCLQ